MKLSHVLGAVCNARLSLFGITSAQAVLIGRLPLTVGGTGYQAYYN